MCIEDVRLGRQATQNQVSKTVAATSGVLLPQNSMRYALLIWNNGPDPLHVSFLNNTTDNVGMTLAANTGLPPLDVQHHGGMVTGQIWISTDAAKTATGVAWETVLEAK